MKIHSLHTNQIKELSDLIHTDRLPHAMLLYGPRGNGKLSVARWFAGKILNHVQESEHAERRVEEGTHPDVHWMFPTPGSDKKQDAQSFINEWQDFLHERPFGSIDDWLNKINGVTKTPNIPAHACAHMLRTLQMKSYEGGAKIQIVWLAEYLKQEANRLLKIIEEPPENTYIIFISEDPDQILATIRSRCFMLHIPMVADDVMNKHLLDHYELTQQQSSLLVQLAEGNLAEAHHLAAKDSTELADLWVDWLRYGFKWRGAEYIQWVSDFGRRPKVDQRLFWKYGLQFTRQVLLKKIYMDKAVVWDTFVHVIEVMQNRLTHSEIIALKELCEQSLSELLRNANVNILMTSAGLRLRDIIHHKEEEIWDVNLVE